MRQYIKVIGALTLDELKDFASTLLRRMRVTLLVGGNIDEAGARAAAAVVKDTLAPLALDPSQIPYSRAVMLPPGNRLHHFPGFNEADDNGAVVLYYEVSHRDTRDSVSLDLLAQIANKPAFEILRTQQQLGYIVFTYKEQHQGVTGLGFIVQSNVVSPAVVDRRVEGFLGKLREILAAMEDEEYTSHIEAVVTAKTEPDKRLAQEVNRAWGEIVSKPAAMNFGRRFQHAKAVQTVTKAELLGFFDRHIAAGAPLRSKLAIHTVSAKFAEDYESNTRGDEAGDDAGLGGLYVEAEAIGAGEADMAAWKAAMPVHPATRAEGDGLGRPAWASEESSA